MERVRVYDEREARVAIRALMTSGTKVCIACTGGGAGVGKMLWDISGISKMLVGFHFPYHRHDTEAFLGFDPEKEGFKSCSPEMAIALARTCYFRAQEAIAKDGDFTSPVVGVGLTAVTQSVKHKRGGTRLFAAVYTREGIHWCHINLKQDYLHPEDEEVPAELDRQLRLCEREGDGAVCDVVALNMALYGAKLEQVHIVKDVHAELSSFLVDGLTSSWRVLCPRAVRAGEDFTRSLTPSRLAPRREDPAELLERGPVLIRENGASYPVARQHFTNYVIMPGSFNPAHYGHMAMVRAIEAETGKRVIFEISGQAVDKAERGVDDLLQRAAQLATFRPVIVRRDGALFVDKANDYVGAEFAIGSDTALRMLDAKYYNNDPSERSRAFEVMLARELVIYVVGRMHEGELLDLESVRRRMPEDLMDLGVGHKIFWPILGRWDISSTAVRGEAKV